MGGAAVILPTIERIEAEFCDGPLADYSHSGTRAEIGFCSGSFDILHVGHVRFLEACADRCDVLVVMVGTDAQIRHAKGHNRPVIEQQARLEMVNALKAVDYCFLDPFNRFDLSGLDEAFRLVNPDRYFVRADARNPMYRRQLCAKTQVEYITVKDDVPEFSTTKIIDRIREDHHARIA
jgi:cytidyltransferase-like protein